MALKDKQSRFDLVNGENPVSNMENQQGPTTYNSLNGTSQSPFSYNSKVDPADYMVALLNQTVNSSNTGQIYNPAPNQSDFQDLNGATPSKYIDNLPQ